MQKIILLLVFFAFGCKGKSQTSPASNSEFTKNNNGLIYSEQDIKSLRFVVDSLNLKFKTCDLNKAYLAYPQARVCSVRFKSTTNDLSSIRKDLEKMPDYVELLNKYKDYVDRSDSNLMIVALPINEEGEQNYLSGNASSGFEREYIARHTKVDEIKKWTWSYSKKDKYTDYYSLDCIYFPGSFLRPVIPADYARLIQYVDCMIDTNATIYLTGAERDDPFTSEGKNIYYDQLNTYLNKKMRLKKGKENYEFNYLTEAKIQFLKDSLAADSYAVKTANDLVNWSINNNKGSGAAEELAAIFVSKRAALDMKRKRRVVGMCSQDRSPRVHALSIAMLAAESHSWDIFLRAHLDIMNDRFDRVSDGSYAWEQRQTYIKELEELDLNVIDMMIGLCLRAYNNADNHYNGTVWRIGKALSESKDRLLFEEKAKKIMKDELLDEFNRSLIFLLYQNYLYHLADKKETALKMEELKNTFSGYPDFIQKAIKKIEVKTEE